MGYGDSVKFNGSWLNKSVFVTSLVLVSLIVFSVVTSAADIAEHLGIAAWEGTDTCLACHEAEAEEVFHSVHYQWLGDTPYLVTGPEKQGKLDLGVNSYCINITGNWTGCSNCHVGLGDRPTQEIESGQLNNIDCLICHQEAYKRKKVDGVFVPDSSNMEISMLEAARTVHPPNKVTCLQCHAKGGGGDNYKRGDLALAHGVTADIDFDVHMASAGADLSCQDCHLTENHLIAGRGSDLRPTELDVEMACSSCHAGKEAAAGHSTATLDRHISRVACQTCHIRTFARNASDTTATEKTEISRDWRQPHVTASGAIHPTPVMAGDLIPTYAWWDGRSSTYLLYDDALIDPLTGRIPTSRPVGEIFGSGAKIYPFKYKTATQPLVQNHNQLIALDTSVYFSTGDVVASVESGLVNMGYQGSEPYSWEETDTYQLITHEVSPVDDVLQCSDCHSSNARIDLVNDLGYALKSPRNELCVQCHELEDGEDEPEYLWIHSEHVREERYDCSWCHTFSRPERGLRLHPLFENLSYTIDVLRVLTGLAPSTTVEDQNGDGQIGLAEAIHYLKSAAAH